MQKESRFGVAIVIIMIVLLTMAAMTWPRSDKYNNAENKDWRTDSR